MPRKTVEQPSSITANEKESAVSVWSEIDRRLLMYGTSNHNNRNDLLEELAFIILSAQTESYLYLQTFDDLRARFPKWDMLLEAPEDAIAAVIRRGGLANKKAAQLKAALQKIKSDTGELSLEFLGELDDDEARHYLRSLPGIGNKSAACVMLYVLHREVFPVDTHVWRVCQHLGLAPTVPKPTDAQERALEAAVPKELRYRLHVNLLSHGQQTCTTYWPKCSACVLADICPSRDKPDEVWGQWRRPRGIWARALTETSVERE